MDLVSSLILLAIVIILIVLFVTWPLSSRHRPEVEGSQYLSSLMAEHDRVLNSLKELDFDNSLGKIPAESYPSQRANLVQKGAELLRKIDQLAPVLEEDPNLRSNHEDQIETILATRRARQAKSAVTGDEEFEKLLTKRRRILSVKQGVYCSHCGKPLSNSERYCPNCGHPVQ